MNERSQEILSKDAQAIIHFSDVFSSPEVDFDAELTAIIRNFGTLSDRTYFIGGNAGLAGYGAVLLNDLIAERKRISREVDMADPYVATTLYGVLNALPREGYAIEEAPNGKDFHLAITSSGVCFFACPLTTLSALESRNEILSLYRIPNEKLPFTNGTKEQFRSSIVALSRFRTEVMEVIYEYATIDEVVVAKASGAHPTIIPEQEQKILPVYADRFGNVRLSVKDSDALYDELRSFESNQVRITIDGKESLPALFVESLSDIPIGSLGLYQNVADMKLPHRKTAYWELVKRSDHCLEDKEMAYNLLKSKRNDFWNASIEIAPRLDA